MTGEIIISVISIIIGILIGYLKVRRKAVKIKKKFERGEIDDDRRHRRKVKKSSGKPNGNSRRKSGAEEGESATKTNNRETEGDDKDIRTARDIEERRELSVSYNKNSKGGFQPSGFTPI